MSEPTIIRTISDPTALDRARQVEARDELQLGDRRHEIALVQAARLVVDEESWFTRYSTI
jgi:hypothetical protein